MKKNFIVSFLFTIAIPFNMGGQEKITPTIFGSAETFVSQNTMEGYFDLSIEEQVSYDQIPDLLKKSRATIPANLVYTTVGFNPEVSLVWGLGYDRKIVDFSDYLSLRGLLSFEYASGLGDHVKFYSLGPKIWWGKHKTYFVAHAQYLLVMEGGYEDEKENYHGLSTGAGFLAKLGNFTFQTSWKFGIFPHGTGFIAKDLGIGINF